MDALSDLDSRGPGYSIIEDESDDFHGDEGQLSVFLRYMFCIVFIWIADNNSVYWLYV